MLRTAGRSQNYFGQHGEPVKTDTYTLERPGFDHRNKPLREFYL